MDRFLRIQDCPDKGSCLNEVLIEELEADRDHWRGECRRLAELAVRHHKKRLLRDLEELESEAERILKELDK